MTDIRLQWYNMILSVEIVEKCARRVFCKEILLQKIGEYKISTHINHTHVLDELSDNVKKLDSRCNPDGLSLLSALQDQSFKNVQALKFITEQLYLMTLNKLQYESEFMIFASLLYSCSPQEYWL